MAQPRNSDHLSGRIALLQAQMKASDPSALAARTGADYQATTPGKGEFRLRLWERPVVISFPAFRARDEQTEQELPAGMQALLLYYFSLSNGRDQIGRWISFSELPDGRFYNQAFQGYTGKVIARQFQNDLAAFKHAAETAGGQRYPKDQGLGDAAYVFQALPRVSLLAAYWCGDEDFPASCQILFDASAGHHLSTDGCAILGSILTHRILR